MLGNHFYHSLSRKYISAFGSMFNQIYLVRYDKSHTVEMSRSLVPLVYGPREKYLTRINSDADLEKGVAQTLPMMSFSLLDMQYNSSIKQNSLMRHPRANNTSGFADSVYMGTPYDLMFTLSIIARHTDDAFQIIEQILPTFNPSYTFSQILIPDIGFVRDVPLILNGVSNNTDYEGDFDEIRTVEYLLDFTMKVYFYGEIENSKIIKQAFANTYIDQSIQQGSIVRVNVNNGNNGIYQLEDVVYQGNTIVTATAAGIVTKWSANNSYLRIAGTQGNFKISDNIKAASTNADYTLASFDASPLKIQSIDITIDPPTANADDTFGFTEVIQEYPITD